MNMKKQPPFTKDILQLATWAKALAHPARLAILTALLERKTCVCGDLVEGLPLAQSTVSQHLKVLKQAGLIQGNIEGASVCYCIQAEHWDQARQALSNWLNQENQPKQNCC